MGSEFEMVLTLEKTTSQQKYDKSTKKDNSPPVQSNKFIINASTDEAQAAYYNPESKSGTDSLKSHL